MSDTLETLRAAIDALSRRKSALSPEGKGRLAVLSSNLKLYAGLGGGVLHGNVLARSDERVVALIRKLLLEDIAAIEAELRDAKEE